jgi:hypothetical protein
MKSSLIFSFLLGALFISGCRKDDNPKVPDFEKVPVPLITLAEGSETKISGDDPTSFSSSVVVDTYFKFGEMPKHYDLVVIKNGDKSNPKVIQSAISTFPTTVTITGQQLIDLFGDPIELGDAFDIGADVFTLDGKKYDAFPQGAITYAPGIADLPGSSTGVRFAAPCLFNPEDYTSGAYEVVVDEWADYQPGDPVSVTKIDDTHYSFEYAADNPNPIVIEVNPADNSATVAPVMYGDYGGIEVTASSVAGSEVDPCDVSFKLILNHFSPDFGDLGNYAITLRKL